MSSPPRPRSVEEELRRTQRRLDVLERLFMQMRSNDLTDDPGSVAGLRLNDGVLGLAAGTGSTKATFDEALGSTTGASWDGSQIVGLAAGGYLLIGHGAIAPGGTGRASMRWSDTGAGSLGDARPQQQDGWTQADISLGVNYRGVGFASFVEVFGYAEIETWVTKSMAATIDVFDVGLLVVRV